jgi:hypothetical protein
MSIFMNWATSDSFFGFNISTSVTMYDEFEDDRNVGQRIAPLTERGKNTCEDPKAANKQKVDGEQMTWDAKCMLAYARGSALRSRDKSTNLKLAVRRISLRSESITLLQI